MKNNSLLRQHCGTIPHARKSFFTVNYKVIEEDNTKIVIHIFNVTCTKSILTVGGEEEIDITATLKDDFIKKVASESLEKDLQKRVYIRTMKQCNQQHCIRILETLDNRFIAEVKDQSLFYEISEALAKRYKQQKYEFIATTKKADELITFK